MDQQSEAEAYQVLRALTGRSDARFHDGQLEAIGELVDGRRVLVVQRTGWGKSAVYFIATRLLRDRGYGPTLLVSPLIALMRNQIEAAERAGIRAKAINSSNPADHAHIMEMVGEDEVDLLLISEQRLKNEEFRRNLLPTLTRRSGLLVVDEAHCISDWGHDFRPWYRRIAQFVQLLPPTVPVLACTATANDRVVADIESQLGSGMRTLRGPLHRPGLSLQVLDIPNRVARLAWLAETIPVLDGTGIVYCLTRDDTEEVAAFLADHGIEAAVHHGSVPDQERIVTEQRLLDNDLDVVVATSALGMGFDKPDLAFVIHYQMPGSPIAYYQQVGRAGRQLNASVGVGLVGAEDEGIQDWFIDTAFPSPELANAAVAALDAADGGLKAGRLLEEVNIRPGRLEAMLTQLEVEGIVERRDGHWHRTIRPWVYPHDRVEAVTAERRREQAAMVDYHSTPGCRSQHLLALLDDPDPQPCGLCDNCAGPRFVAGSSPQLLLEARRYLRHQYVPLPPRQQWPSKRWTDTRAIPEGERVEPGWALCRWGDPVYGQAISDGKHDGAFDDTLVEALLSLVEEQTASNPPTWVASIPSRRSPVMVRALAERLAAALEVPYVDCLEKGRPTAQQKGMENSNLQVENLWNAFAVKGVPPIGRGLLVDDMVDSRWTFTLAGRELRRAGSGPLVPIALASTAGSGDA